MKEKDLWEWAFIIGGVVGAYLLFKYTLGPATPAPSTVAPGSTPQTPFGIENPSAGWCG